MDACLQLSIYSEKSFSYPIGFSRIVFWEGCSLDDVSLWVYKKSHIPQRLSINKEKFIKYHETDTIEESSVIVALLVQESTNFSVLEPILSS